MVAIQHVVAEPQLVELNGWHVLLPGHRHAQALQTLVIAASTRPTHGTEVGTELSHAPHAADDARDFDALQVRRPTLECARPSGRVVEAEQGRRRGRRLGRPNQDDRTRRPAHDIVSDAPSHQLDQTRARVGTEDDHRRLHAVCLGHERFRGAAG
jgi:hypothetical protein